jgi:glycosyltransferase involved in cell wall biosynthesis
LNKHTLYITFDGLSDPLGQSQILPYLCGIAKNGYQITILSCEKEDRLKHEQVGINALIKSLPITWKYILYDQEGGFFSRFLYIKKLTALAKDVISKHSITLIHCRSYLSSLIGLKFKEKFNIPFVFDMRGFWADERIDGLIWKKNNLLHSIFYNYFKKKEKQYLRNADAIISLTYSAITELEKKFPNFFLEKKITVIPCCTNTNLFSNEKLVQIPDLAGINTTDHVIIYTGSIGTWYFTKELIDCILVWKKHIPNIKLLFVTKDLIELDLILNQYSKVENSIIVKVSATYKEVPAYLSIAKASMFFIKPSYSKIASSPTKMAECWAMNLPIITNSGIGDNDLYFNIHKGGILINDFTIEEYEKACLNYLNLNYQNLNYRQIALSYFDNQTAILKYSAVYDSLTQKGLF